MRRSAPAARPEVDLTLAGPIAAGLLIGATLFLLVGPHAQGALEGSALGAVAAVAAAAAGVALWLAWRAYR